MNNNKPISSKRFDLLKCIPCLAFNKKRWDNANLERGRVIKAVVGVIWLLGLVCGENGVKDDFVYKKRNTENTAYFGYFPNLSRNFPRAQIYELRSITHSDCHASIRLRMRQQ